MSSRYVSVALRRRLRSASDRRCAYCRSAETVTGMPLEVEHIIPRRRGGKTTFSNLCLACHRCNEFKGDRLEALDPVIESSVLLFNPNTQDWRQHFKWSPDEIKIIGKTPCGRATVEALQLNNENVVGARRLWTVFGFTSLMH